MDDYEPESAFEALGRLASFNDDAALEGIKKGMRPPAGKTQRREGDNDTVRHSTACALLRSRHPEAKQLLLTMWNDPYREVRVIVVDALAKMKMPESLDLLRKMTHDSDKGVRDSASECLESRAEKPGKAKN